jgi:glycosyltransferase involved in cell wall biosynthesis
MLKKMKIGILGTRGVPNYYGGFEQFAEFFSVFLVENGHEVIVYNSHNHPFQEKSFKGVSIVHCYDPEYKIGSMGQFIYDLNCIMDARNQKFDIILQLGYTSSSIWFSLHPKNSIVITNMDGLEWKRTKYNKLTQKLLKFAEKFAVVKSHYLISDSKGIQDYIEKKYKKESTYIAYGAHLFTEPKVEILDKYGLKEGCFNMVMARFEPENNIEMVLDGVVMSQIETPIIVVGNYKTKYGQYLVNKFNSYPSIKFLGAIYDINDLNNLRYFSNVYFHGHTVGGTNPSLLEAMSSKALVVAHSNSFNKGVLNENAYYFSNSDEVKKILKTVKKIDNLQLIQNNFDAIQNNFNWQKINEQYLQLFKSSLDKYKAESKKQ